MIYDFPHGNLENRHEIPWKILMLPERNTKTRWSRLQDLRVRPQRLDIRGRGHLHIHYIYIYILYTHMIRMHIGLCIFVCTYVHVNVKVKVFVNMYMYVRLCMRR